MLSPDPDVEVAPKNATCCQVLNYYCLEEESGSEWYNRNRLRKTLTGMGMPFGWLLLMTVMAIIGGAGLAIISPLFCAMGGLIVLIFGWQWMIPSGFWNAYLMLIVIGFTFAAILMVTGVICWGIVNLIRM